MLTGCQMRVTTLQAAWEMASTSTKMPCGLYIARDMQRSLSACRAIHGLPAMLQHKAHLIFNCDVGAGVVGDVHLQPNPECSTMSRWRCSEYSQ